jgi:acyl-CoA thioesterase-1
MGIQFGYLWVRGCAKRLRVLTAAFLIACPAWAQDEPITVVALGDSLTAGYGLPRQDGFVRQLQAWLDIRGADARVQNAGVSGETSAGGLSRVDRALGEHADALIVALGGNDYLRGVDPVRIKANLRGILETARERGLPVLLVGINASDGHGPEYEVAFDSMYPELAEEFGALLEADWFEGLREPGVELPETRARYLQRDGIHPNAAGVERIVERIGPRVLELVGQVN